MAASEWAIRHSIPCRSGSQRNRHQLLANHTARSYAERMAKLRFVRASRSSSKVRERLSALTSTWPSVARAISSPCSRASHWPTMISKSLIGLPAAEDDLAKGIRLGHRVSVVGAGFPVIELSFERNVVAVDRPDILRELTALVTDQPFAHAVAQD